MHSIPFKLRKSGVPLLFNNYIINIITNTYIFLRGKNLWRSTSSTFTNFIANCFCTMHKRSNKCFDEKCQIQSWIKNYFSSEKLLSERKYVDGARTSTKVFYMKNKTKYFWKAMFLRFMGLAKMFLSYHLNLHAQSDIYCFYIYWALDAYTDRQTNGFWSKIYVCTYMYTYTAGHRLDAPSFFLKQNQLIISTIVLIVQIAFHIKVWTMFEKNDHSGLICEKKTVHSKILQNSFGNHTCFQLVIELDAA